MNVLHSWKNIFRFHLLTPRCLRTQFLWFNKDIKANNTPFHFPDFSKENIRFFAHLCKPSGDFQSWSKRETEYNLEEKMIYKKFQLLHAIPNQRKRKIKTIND